MISVRISGGRSSFAFCVSGMNFDTGTRPKWCLDKEEEGESE